MCGLWSQHSPAGIPVGGGELTPRRGQEEQEQE